MCLACEKRTPIALLQQYSQQIRILKRYQRDETTPETKYYWIACMLAKTWSRIRLALDVQPEFPAGLRYFLKEMGL